MGKSSLPAAPFYPFRLAVTRLRRGHPVRSAAIAILKSATNLSPGLPTSISEVRPLDRTDLSFLPSDSMVMEAVYWFGICGYEGIMSEVWRALCGRSHSILEIGGNVGLFSVIGGKEAPGTYAVVEPVPQVAAMLRENLKRNGLRNIELLEGAVIPSLEPGEVKISLPDEGHAAPVGAHLLEGVEVEGRSQLKLLSVHGYPMISLAKGRDLIKIDAEGIEAQLLSAVRDMLVADRPTLVIEVLPEAENLAALLRDLAFEAGYSIYIVPEYGSDEIVLADTATFTSALPQQHQSKDVVLSTLSVANLLPPS